MSGGLITSQTRLGRCHVIMRAVVSAGVGRGVFVKVGKCERMA